MSTLQRSLCASRRSLIGLPCHRGMKYPASMRFRRQADTSNSRAGEYPTPESRLREWRRGHRNTNTCLALAPLAARLAILKASRTGHIEPTDLRFPRACTNGIFRHRVVRISQKLSAKCPPGCSTAARWGWRDGNGHSFSLLWQSQLG